MPHRTAKPLARSGGVTALFALATLVAVSPITAAAQSVVEPIVTEEALPNEPGEWDLRWSNEYRRHESGSTMQSPRMQFFFGMTDRLGGDVDASFVLARDAERHFGPGDVETTLKWLLVAPGGALPAIAVGWEVGWPTGSRENGTGEGAVEQHPFIAILKNFGLVNVQGDIGWSRARHDDETEVGAPYNWALGVPLRRPDTAVLVELNGRIGARGEHSPAALSLGMRYGLGRDTSVAVAVPVGLTRESDSWGIVTQWQIGR